MAEWLRRLTRNQMGSSRVGSNPTHSGQFHFIFDIIKTVLSPCCFSRRQSKGLYQLSVAFYSIASEKVCITGSELFNTGFRKYFSNTNNKMAAGMFARAARSCKSSGKAFSNARYANSSRTKATTSLQRRV